MSTLRAAARIALKDLRIEARTGEVVVTVGLFAFLVTVLASLSFYIDQSTAVRVAPGVLWITVTFSGVLAMGRSWARERDNDAMRGLLLAPIPRSAIYWGKAVGALVFLLVVEVLLLPLVALLFHLDLAPVLWPLVVVLLLGTIGFVAAGTLFSAMSVRSTTRDLVLSVVLFPLVSPALLAGVVATRELLGGAPLSEILGWFRILGAFDIVFLAGGTVLFDPLTSD
jgi:heme exporter protein B